MKKEIDVNEVAAFLDTCGPDTKVYVGADSERFQIDGEWYADYILAVVVHIVVTAVRYLVLYNVNVTLNKRKVGHVFV